MKRKLNKGLAFIAATAMMALLFAPVAQAVPGNVPINPEDRCMECMVDGNPRKVYVPGVPLEDSAGNWRHHPPVDHWMPYNDFLAFDFGGGHGLISRGDIVWIPGWNPGNQYTNGQVQGFSDWIFWDGDNHYAGTWWADWPVQHQLVPTGYIVWDGYDGSYIHHMREWREYPGCNPADCTHPGGPCLIRWQLWEWQTRLPDWGPYQAWIYFTTHGGWILGPGHWEYYCACEVPGVPCDDCGEYPCECVDPPPPPVCDECGEYPCVCEPWVCVDWTEEQYAKFDKLLAELEALWADAEALIDLLLNDFCTVCNDYDYWEILGLPEFLDWLEWIREARGCPNDFYFVISQLKDGIESLKLFIEENSEFLCTCEDEKCCDDYPDCECDEEDPAPPRAPQTGDVASAAPFVFGALMSLSALAGGITLKKRNK